NRLIVTNNLHNNLLLKTTNQIDDRLNHQPINITVTTVAHKLAIDLQEVERQVLEVVERPEARPEVVESEAAAELGESLAEPPGRAHVGHGCGLGHLEDQSLRRHPGAPELRLDDLEQLRVAERTTREVDLQGERAPTALVLLE